MSTTAAAPSSNGLLHRRAGTGPGFWGPGDRYTFLVTGEESGGAYFVMEAWVPSGGGPGPHIHTREDETFYVLLTFTPAGIEGFFRETLDPAPNAGQDAPDNHDEVGARYAAAAARYGMTFV